MVPRRALTAIVVVALAACGGASPSPDSTAAGPATAAPDPTATARPSPTLPAGVSRVVPIGEHVYGISAAEDSIWVEGANRLLQLDAVTGEQRRALPGWAPRVDATTLWYLRGDQLVEADSLTGAERAVYTPPHLATTVLERTLWAASEETGTLYAIDLDTNELLHETELPDGEPKWVEAWEEAIWVVIDGIGSGVYRYDPATGRQLTGLALAGKRPHSVTVGFGSLWVSDHGSANLYRMALDGTLDATIPGPGWEVAVATTADSVWAAASKGLLRVDPSTNAVIGEITLGLGDWYGLAAASGYLWLTTGGGKRLLQMPVPGS